MWRKSGFRRIETNHARTSRFFPLPPNFFSPAHHFIVVHLVVVLKGYHGSLRSSLLAYPTGGCVMRRRICASGVSPPKSRLQWFGIRCSNNSFHPEVNFLDTPTPSTNL